MKIYKVFKKKEQGSTDSFVIGFSKIRPFLKSTHNFQINKSNYLYLRNLLTQVGNFIQLSFLDLQA